MNWKFDFWLFIKCNRTFDFYVYTSINCPYFVDGIKNILVLVCFFIFLKNPTSYIVQHEKIFYIMRTLQ
jgi:hypothetical protein